MQKRIASGYQLLAVSYELFRVGAHGLEPWTFTLSV